MIKTENGKTMIKCDCECILIADCLTVIQCAFDSLSQNGKEILHDLIVEDIFNYN